MPETKKDLFKPATDAGDVLSEMRGMMEGFIDWMDGNKNYLPAILADSFDALRATAQERVDRSQATENALAEMLTRLDALDLDARPALDQDALREVVNNLTRLLGGKEANQAT